MTAIPWSMQSGAVTTDLAFVQPDLVLIKAHHGLQLVVEDLTFFVNRIFYHLLWTHLLAIQLRWLQMPQVGPLP